MSRSRLVNRYFSDADFEAVKTAVAAVESRTSGEIIVRLTAQSHPWGAEKLLIACFASLVAIAASLCLTREINWGVYYDFSQAVLWGLIAFLVGYFGIAPLLRTATRRRGFVWRRAVEIFKKLTATKGQTGVLILVSLAEAEAAIVADKAIAQRLNPNYWDHPHAILVSSIREERHSEGLIAAIKEIGEKLIEHFPIQPGDVNELPDRPEIA